MTTQRDPAARPGREAPWGQWASCQVDPRGHEDPADPWGQ